MKTLYLTVIISLFCFSCIKEKNTYSTTTFINTSTHSIEVKPWFNSSVNSTASFSLAPNESKVVDDSNIRGLGVGVSYGYLSAPNDSIAVSFDNNVSIVHYKTILIGSNTKRYLFQSKRNIYNDSSYAIQLVKDEKYTRVWSFRYTFTEQDYLDAKQ